MHSLSALLGVWGAGDLSPCYTGSQHTPPACAPPRLPAPTLGRQPLLWVRKVPGQPHLHPGHRRGWDMCCAPSPGRPRGVTAQQCPGPGLSPAPSGQGVRPAGGVSAPGSPSAVGWVQVLGSQEGVLSSLPLARSPPSLDALASQVTQPALPAVSVAAWKEPRGPSASPDPRVSRWGNSRARLYAASVSPTRLRLFW